MDPRAGLDGCGKSRLHRNSIPAPSSPYRVAIPNTLFRPTEAAWFHNKVRTFISVDLHTLQHPAYNCRTENKSQVPQSETTKQKLHFDRIQACDKPNPPETLITVHWSQPSYHDQYLHIRRKGSNVCLVTL